MEYDFYHLNRKQRARLRSLYIKVEYKGEPLVRYGSTGETVAAGGKNPYAYRVYRQEVTEERVVGLNARVIFTTISVIMIGLTVSRSPALAPALTLIKFSMAPTSIRPSLNKQFCK